MGAVIFAHKTTEGWEALLSGLIRGGWTITASWPITTEMDTRLRARDSAALSSSVHLILRTRTKRDSIGGWEEILQKLPDRIALWVDSLSTQGIRGADLVFSCIGPAMELYSRYSRVETADGREVKLDEFLAKVWEVLGRTALQRVLGGGKGADVAGALEEDARLTALFLWTLQSTANGTSRGENKGKALGKDEGEESVEEADDEDAPRGKAGPGYSLPFDIVRRFAQPLGIHLEDWEGRIIETDKGVVRLLLVTERASRLFGRDGADRVAKAIQERSEKWSQTTLFPDQAQDARGAKNADKLGKKGRKKTAAPGVTREATTLDRLHAAMLLQKSGQSAALRTLLEDEVRRGPEFGRLADALSALYPPESEEKRLLDAMILVMMKK
jgi:hypothetical protein